MISMTWGTTVKALLLSMTWDKIVMSLLSKTFVFPEYCHILRARQATVGKADASCLDEAEFGESCSRDSDDEAAEGCGAQEPNLSSDAGPHRHCRISYLQDWCFQLFESGRVTQSERDRERERATEFQTCVLAAGAD